MREHPARDPAQLSVPSHRKRPLQVAQGQAAMGTVERMERHAEQRARPENGAHRQHAYHGNHRRDGEVLQAMTERRRMISQRCCRGLPEATPRASGGTRAGALAPL
jgi:hypothetical protein